jgi:hypothetical protein
MDLDSSLPVDPPRFHTPPKRGRKLSPEELERVFHSKPPRNITAIYVTGIKAQKIRSLKTILKEQCNVTLRNVQSIDFIERSVKEFRVFSDYESP